MAIRQQSQNRATARLGECELAINMQRVFGNLPRRHGVRSRPVIDTRWRAPHKLNSKHDDTVRRKPGLTRTSLETADMNGAAPTNRRGGCRWSGAGLNPARSGCGEVEVNRWRTWPVTQRGRTSIQAR
jgi:hypothetical protein